MLRKYGKELTKEAARVGVGKRPLECWAAIASELGIGAPAQELVDASEPELQERCAVTIAHKWSNGHIDHTSSFLQLAMPRTIALHAILLRIVETMQSCSYEHLLVTPALHGGVRSLLHTHASRSAP